MRGLQARLQGARRRGARHSGAGAVQGRGRSTERSEIRKVRAIGLVEETALAVAAGGWVQPPCLACPPLMGKKLFKGCAQLT